MLSSTWEVISRSEIVPVSCNIRSARVDLPWSMWAMMEKLRICMVKTEPYLTANPTLGQSLQGGRRPGWTV